MRFLLISFLLCCTALHLQAQKYITAAGLRFGDEKLGLTIQQRIFNKTTVELIGQAGRRELVATALAAQHFNLLGKRLNLYLGAGAHTGTVKEYGHFYGADAILGAEYKVNGLPLLVSADIKPALHIHHPDWFALASGFSIRYVFIPEKKPKKAGFLKKIFGKEEDEKDND